MDPTEDENKQIWYKVYFYDLVEDKKIYGWISCNGNVGFGRNDFFQKNKIILYKVVEHKPNEFLNVRIGPGSKFRIIDRLPYNQKNIIIKSRLKSEYGNEWCWINYDNIGISKEINNKSIYTNREGFVFCKYLKKYYEINNKKQNTYKNNIELYYRKSNETDGIKVSGDSKYFILRDRNDIYLYDLKRGMELSKLDIKHKYEISEFSFNSENNQVLIILIDPITLGKKICIWSFLENDECSIVDVDLKLTTIYKIKPEINNMYYLFGSDFLYRFNTHKNEIDKQKRISDLEALFDYKVGDISNDFKLIAYTNKYKQDGWGKLILYDIFKNKEVYRLNISKVKYELIRFTNDNRKIILKSKNFILKCNLSNKSCKKYNNNYPVFLDMRLTKDDKYMVVTTNKKQVLLYKTTSFNEIREIVKLNNADNIRTIKYIKSRDSIYQLFEKEIMQWDLKQAKCNKIKHLKYKDVYNDFLIYEKIIDDNRYLLVFSNGEVFYFNNSKLYKHNLHTELFNRFYMEYHDNRLYYYDEEEKRLFSYDLISSKKNKSPKIDNILISAMLPIDKKVIVGSLLGMIIEWDINKNRFMLPYGSYKSQETSIESLCMLSDRYILFSDNIMIYLLDKLNHKVGNKFLGHKNNITYIKKINSKRFLTGDADGYIKSWYIDSTIPEKEFRDKSSVSIREIDFFRNKIVSLENNGMIRIWDYNNTKLLANLKIFDNDNWIITTPENYFSGTYKLNKFSIIKQYKTTKINFIDFSQLYDHFFRPDLVKLKLNGEEEAYQKAIAGMSYKEALKNPPPRIEFVSVDNRSIKKDGFDYSVVKVSKDRAKITFRVKEGDGGGVGLIRVYQEGKLIHAIGKGNIKRRAADLYTSLEEAKKDRELKEMQREYRRLLALKNAQLSVDQILPPDTSTPLSRLSNPEGNYTVTSRLKPGSNQFCIEAFNKTNTVASYRECVNIQADIPKRKPNLYGIVAGVNNFKRNYQPTLRYSQNDALSIKKSIEDGGKGLYENIEIKPILGEEVSEENILRSIKEIQKKAKVDDTILFFISTHGSAYKGNLYLMPYNGDKGEPYISFKKIFNAVQNIPSLKEILIVDACQSGQASDIMSSVYDSRASVLAKSAGVHLLMATTRGTSAFESQDPKVKNSIFTHKILTILKDKKTDLNHDNTISALELSNALKEQTGDTEKQYPIIRNIGSDIRLIKVF